MYDVSRKAVEAISDKSNELVLDKYNLPSVMVKIPKMRMNELIDGGSENVHPAFKVNGVEKDYIYVSKYQNVVIGDVGLSLPLEFPTTNVTFDEAQKYCENKGSGWHLMTNAEYSLLALLALKKATLPNGNNNNGTDSVSSTDYGILDEEGKKVATGSGNPSWTHDHTKAGIYDLNGNVNEWISGLRLLDGQIQVLLDNNAAQTGINSGKESLLWRPIKTDGSTGENGETEGTLFYDYTSEETPGGTLTIKENGEHKQNEEANYCKATFASLYQAGRSEGITALALATSQNKEYKGDTVIAKTSGERIALRGGSYKDQSEAGIFHLDLTQQRAYKGDDVGFRCCYIPE